jgi:hypothetical protein
MGTAGWAFADRRQGVVHRADRRGQAITGNIVVAGMGGDDLGGKGQQCGVTRLFSHFETFLLVMLSLGYEAATPKSNGDWTY